MPGTEQVLKISIMIIQTGPAQTVRNKTHLASVSSSEMWIMVLLLKDEREEYVE